MTGQIAGPSIFSLELVGLVVGVSMIIGAIDLLRQPGWAWKRAEESKAAYLILVLLLPLVGLGLYLFRARPKVAPSPRPAGRPACPSSEFGRKADQGHREDSRHGGTPAAPMGLGSFGAAATATTVVGLGGGLGRSLGSQGGGGQGVMLETEPVDPPAPVEVSATFFSTGGVATRTARSPVGLARTYRPKQRTSLTESIDARPTVPAGWKADPTGRHQFRYWDGFQWTENVADAGDQTRDPVS